MIERLWGLDLPDTSDELQAWHGRMDIDPEAPAAERLDDPQHIQAALIRLGLDLGPSGADGKWGTCSRAATSTFQHAHDLPVTGQPDAATIAALRTALSQQV